MITAIVDMTIGSIMNPAISSHPDPTWRIKEPLGCLEEPNGDGGQYGCNVTPIIHKNTAAKWVKVVMKLCNPTLFYVVYSGTQANASWGGQIPIHGGRSVILLDDILPPPAHGIIEDIGEKSDKEHVFPRLNPRCSPKMNTGFQMFEWKLQKFIQRQ
jgi:hypothetical protein